MNPVSADSSWTAPALEIVGNACEHYGGLEVWRSLQRIRLKPNRLTGLLPLLKGAGRTFQLTGDMEISPAGGRVRFLSFPDEAHVGLFENGRVQIQRAEDGAVVVESDNQRSTFVGLAKFRSWSPLDALYFFGYALSHYHALPFTLLDARMLSLTRAREGANALDVLTVEFRPQIQTHCRRQRFYIDGTGRIVRHDYVADIIGFWARAAHFWKREVYCNGFPVSLERHVLARIGTWAVPITALRATFLEAEVDRAGPEMTRPDMADAAARQFLKQ